MRKGYWLALTRQLRAKVASGENQFLHRDGVFTVSTVRAGEDASLDCGGEIELAADEQGMLLVMDPGSSSVTLVQTDGKRLELSSDLLAFVNALVSLEPQGLELGPVVGEPLDFPSPHRGILDDH